MAKKAVVKFTGGFGNGELRDFTIGSFYHASIPSFGEFDKDGMAVAKDDELWVIADDAGDEIVTNIGSGFEIVWSEK